MAVFVCTKKYICVDERIFWGFFNGHFRGCYVPVSL